jgi:hypothetical protein
MPVNGSSLTAFIGRIDEETRSNRLKPGTKVWANFGEQTGQWPGLVWAIGHCRKDDLADIILTYKSGRHLVKFYGEHSLSWVSERQITMVSSDESYLIKKLEMWGKRHKQ